MYRLKDLQPIKLDDLVRVGRNFDGGYVIVTSKFTMYKKWQC
jgi:hypothetical protein